MGGGGGRRAAWTAIGIATLLVLPAGAAGAAPAPTPVTAPPDGTGLPARLATRLRAGIDPLRATSTGPHLQASTVPVLGDGTLSYPDPAFDADLAAGDITNLAVTRTPQMTRFALSTRAPHHNVAAEQIIFWLDRENDGTPERAVVATQGSSARMIAGVVSLSGTPRLLCSGATTGNPISVTVPTTCLGAMPSLHVAASLHSGDVFGLPQDDDVPAAGLVGPVGAGAGTAGSMAYGGFVLTTAGDVQWFSLDRDRPAPGLSRFVAAELPGARAIAVGPDGANGYVMDGSGHMLPLGVGDDFGGAAPIDGPQFTFDAARALTVAPNGERGWVLDAYGGLHHFSVAQRHAAPALLGAPYWRGWDIARSVALLPDGTGGWILDGFGGLHFFSVGTARAAPRVLDAPYWTGWDVARSITVLPDGTGGWVVDGFGGSHFFSIGTRRTAPAVLGAPYRAGGNLVAGTALVRSRPSLPTAAPAPGIPLPGARAVQFDAPGTTLYAVASDGVKVIDVGTERIVDSIAVGTEPDAIAMAPDRKRLAVANTGSADVSIVDLATRHELRRIPVPIANPATLTLAYGSDGAVYVHGGSPNDTWRLDVATGAVTVVPGLSGSGLLAGSGDGRRLFLLTLGVSGWTVRRFDLATASVVRTRTLATADPGIPNGIAIDGPGNRVLIAPGGPILDANLDTVIGGGSTGAPIAATLDAWGVHWLRAIDHAVTMNAIDGSTSEQFSLFGRLGTDMFGVHDDLAATFDLHTFAVVTQTGVELVHR